MPRSERLKTLFTDSGWSIAQTAYTTSPVYVIQHVCLYGKGTTFFAWQGPTCKRCKNTCPESVQVLYVFLRSELGN